MQSYGDIFILLPLYEAFSDVEALNGLKTGVGGHGGRACNEALGTPCILIARHGVDMQSTGLVIEGIGLVTKGIGLMCRT